ncbi:type I-B CRISPR-associated protein Cas8b1/Cst1 [Paenibacillus sp. 481]|uniref:type I-B CRISPR-associated protein Cas8b1/Cst1 n=1 Tax=Paenibacillus sp. 481 TaxID=2835869 RepID=UPI001E4DAF5F|nr:type I-B CRISPR-associated protein Cas8b1/Cst1 [Paenibacillus sp. 481]UHA72659.1 type I-B CRISPR-associated protein Cas8b1/Cst1 [Paenibacillus sp. 481]
MDKLTLPMDDYLLAMGGVGVWRIYQYGKKAEIIDEKENVPYVIKTESSLEIDPQFLPYIPSLFFHYMLDEHSIAKREQTRLNYYSTRTKDSAIKDWALAAKQSLDTQLKKLEKYFPNDSEITELKSLSTELKSLSTELKSYQSNDQRQEAESTIERYLKILKKMEYDQKLTLNYVKASLMGPLYGQASFLNVAKNSLNLDGHIATYLTDYIHPVQRDLQIQAAFCSNLETKELLAILDSSSASVHKGWKKTLKKWDGDLAAFWDEQLRCTFVDEWFATGNFEEMIFSPLGVSKAYNFAWNLQDKQPVPISSWVKLILFLAPAGLTTYRRRDQSATPLYHSFMYSDGDVDEIIRMNDHLRELEKGETLPSILSKVLRREEKKANVFLPVQFIEFSADYRSKKTILNYFDVPEHITQYFYHEQFGANKKGIDGIRDMALRESFLRLVMQSIDPIRIVMNHLRLAVREFMNNGPQGRTGIYSAWVAFLERHRIEQYKKKGENEMNSVKSKQVWLVYKQGLELQKRLTNKTNTRKEQTTEHVSGPEKRLAAIAYRLLNAVNAGDRQQFFNTVMRLYLQAGMTVNSILLNVHNDEQMDFPTFGGAFITGLLGEDYNDKDKQVNSSNDDPDKDNDEDESEDD